jgi:hypothetical protein
MLFPGILVDCKFDLFYRMKTFLSLLILLFWMVDFGITQAQDPDFHIYLAFGQSNMDGAGAIESQDKVGIDTRFKVIGAVDCTGNHTHQLGKWTTAIPPLVRCWTGLGMSDYFGRTMVQELPVGIKIGIVPVAVSGCDIGLFDKLNYASYAASAPSWMKDIIDSYGGNPYGRLVEVAKLAQKEGVIKGIIFHQGETNTNDPNWKNKVAAVVENLKTDLQLGDVPFLAGELLSSAGACCGSHNVEVNKLPSLIPNAHVISSAGLDGSDGAHFTSASYREFGKRYAKKMITLLGLGITTAISSTTEERMSEQANASFSAYPTPVTDRVTITLPTEMKASFIRVINGSGDVLIKEKASGTSHTMDVAHLPGGLYIIRASKGLRHRTLKIVKRQ